MTDWDAVRVRIQASREALGLSQAQLGQRLGITGNNVAQVEGGLPISERKLTAFAEALGVSVPFLRYGIVTALDRATIEAEAFRAGRRAALVELHAWLGHQERRVVSPHDYETDPEASDVDTFTAEHFAEVPEARRDEILAKRGAATPTRGPSAKDAGRG